MPLSVVTVDRRAVRASSWSLAGEMDVGRDTSMYLIGPDMLEVWMAFLWCNKVELELGGAGWSMHRST